VEEPPLLLAVHRIVGRIEIKDDLVRHSLVRLQENGKVASLLIPRFWNLFAVRVDKYRDLPSGYARPPVLGGICSAP
jgi:hypothetical protein